MIYRIKSLNNPEGKKFSRNQKKERKKEILESDRKTRSQTTSSTISLRRRTK